MKPTTLKEVYNPDIYSLLEKCNSCGHKYKPRVQLSLCDHCYSRESRWAYCVTFFFALSAGVALGMLMK